MKINTFNTHRTYTEHGQRIAWAVKDGSTHFVDYDRMINGTIHHTICTTNYWVLYNYDQGNYSHMSDYDLRSQLELAASKL